MSASKVRMGQVFVEIGADSRRFMAALGKLNKEIGKIGKSMQSLGTRMMGVGAAVAAPIGLAARQFAAFDDAIRATSAVSGATGSDLQMLNDKARELGATTSFTAVQVANLMTELGRAGFRPDEINAMTGAVLDLARATGTDAALSAGIMAATLRQFGLGASEAARAADVLTMAANSTFNTVEGLGESLKYAGPVAKSLGMSLEDTVAVLGVLGNVGIQGSEAGTALRRLSVIAAGSGEELQNLFGITNTDAAGNLKPLVQILDEINTVTANMPVAERTEKMAKAFGLLGITSANVLSQSAGGVAELAAKLQTAEGTARKTAKEMDAGLGGSFRIALSAIEGTALALSDALAPGLQKVVDFIGQAAGALTAFIKQNQEMVVGVTKGIAAFIGIGAAIFTVGTALSIVAAAMGAILSRVVLIVGGVVALAAAVGYATGIFGQLGEIAGQAFGGIYDAIAAGDLVGAMDVLWKGLVAGWTRGVATLMGYVEPWVDLILNTFTYLGTNVMNIWEQMNSGIAQALLMVSATVMGVVDNIVNGVMASFDAMVSAVRKSWNWVQSFIVRGYDLAKENAKVDSEMDARARQRAASRPGVTGRVAAAQDAAREVRGQAARNIAARNAAADATAARRNSDNGRFGAAADAAQADLDASVRGAGLRRGLRSQADSVLEQMAGATTMEALQDLAGEFHALAATGQLTEQQLAAFEEAADAAAERLERTAEAGGVGGAAAADPAAMARAAAEAAASQAEVAGTFSSQALGGMGFGSTLQQKQLDTLKKIEANTQGLGDEGVIS